MGAIIEVTCFPVPTKILFLLLSQQTKCCHFHLGIVEEDRNDVLLEAVCSGISLQKWKNLHFKDSPKANGEHLLPPGLQWKKFPELGLLRMEEPDCTTSYLGDQRKVSPKMGKYLVCRFAVGAKWSSLCA